jgi:hypothetical protein
MLFAVGGIVLLNILYVFIMGAPTPLGAKMMDGIDGLRQYLTLAEKDRMNMAGAPEMSPQHFEKLLPYAVALGVEKPWSRTFEPGLRQPRQAGRRLSSGWYSGNSAAAISPIASAASPPRWPRPSPRRFRARHPVHPPASPSAAVAAASPAVVAAAAAGGAGKHSCLVGLCLTPGSIPLDPWQAFRSPQAFLLDLSPSPLNRQTETRKGRHEGSVDRIGRTRACAGLETGAIAVDDGILRRARQSRHCRACDAGRHRCRGP